LNMDTYKAILERRTIRRFTKGSIPYPILKKCVNAARLAVSGMNLQPLSFLIIDKKTLCDAIFPTLGWAGYIKPKWCPSEDERPTAYIAIFLDKNITPKGGEYDVGAALQNLLLTATNNGLGACSIASINHSELKKSINIPNNLELKLIVALGYPKERSITESFKNTIKYWRDKNRTHHVPKRRLKDILRRNYFN